MSTLSEIANLDFRRNVNLIPFYYDEERTYHISEILNNVVIFVPFGVYFRMMSIKAREAIIYGSVVSFVFEILQFVFAVGATDITDIITNTLGTVIGVSIYGFLDFTFHKNEKLDKVLCIVASICTTLLVAFIALLLLVN